MEEPSIILINGNNNIKAGFSNKQVPSVIPNIIGRPLGLDIFNEFTPLLFGDKINNQNLSSLNISFPIKCNKIEDEDDLMKLWKYIFGYKLSLCSNELKGRKILIGDKLMTFSGQNKMAELIFEKIEFGSLLFRHLANLVLYENGTESGIVVDIGQEQTYIFPLLYSDILENKIKKINIGGRHITNNLIQILQWKHLILNPNDYSDFMLANSIKEKYCFVANENEITLGKETTFNNAFTLLPDGKRLRIDEEKYFAPEILFKSFTPYSNPINKDRAIHEVLFEIIKVKNNLFYFFEIIGPRRNWQSSKTKWRYYSTSWL